MTRDTKTISSAGPDSNAPMICMLIGDELSSKQKAAMIMSYFTESIVATIVNTVAVLVVQAHGTPCTIMK